MAVVQSRHLALALRQHRLRPRTEHLLTAVAACPPLALLLSVELLNQALKRRRAEMATEFDREGRLPKRNSWMRRTCTFQPGAGGNRGGRDAPASRTIVNNKPGQSSRPASRFHRTATTILCMRRHARRDRTLIEVPVFGIEPGDSP